MNLYVDNFCEVSNYLRPWATEIFYDLKQIPIDNNSVYVVGRVQLKQHSELIRQLVDSGIKVIFSNPAEGSETFLHHLQLYGVKDLAESGKLKCIAGGSMPQEYNYLRFEHFLTQPFKFPENIQACRRSNEIFSKKQKPHTFLFLNGRYRPHRRELIHLLAQENLLNSALWTNLDGRELEIKLLPPEYEVEIYRDNIVAAQGNDFVKPKLFQEQWGEIYIQPTAYIDTYFSVVTETIFHYPHSFFTEKIAKPLAMGHPFIAVSNQYFYKDLRNLGFRTFDPIIDESFDALPNGQDRLLRIKDIVADLCRGNLAEMLEAAEPICKYNQQHLQELGPELIGQFPDQFFNFIQ